MAVIKLEAFGGMLPAVDDRLLPENAAAYSRDAYLYSGALIGWRTPKSLFNLVSSTTRMAFRIPQDNAQTAITDASYWLEFADVDTDVVRTPVIDDSFQRYYFASPSVRPKYNTLARIAASSSAWYLGVPAPTNAPAVSPGGGTGLNLASARAYVYTYVTAYGEESAPSPPLVQNGYVDDTWVVTVTAPDANDMGVNRNITETNIYRTVTATDGTASFFLVDTIAAAVTTYNDTISDDIIAENVELPSTTWTPPPDDLQGIIQGANGMVVGFRENEVWFSEPFRPHTFPSAYTLTTEFPIVGLGVCGQAIIVCTMGFPVVLTGASPSGISSNVIHKAEPCTSRGSIRSSADAVYYTSPNGLQAVTPYGTISNTTEKWITRDKWSSLAPLRSVRAVMNGPAYFAFGTVYVDPATAMDNSSQAQTGFSINSPQTASQSVAAPAGADITNPAFGILSAPNSYNIYNVLVDFWTAVPMLIQNQKVYYYDFTDAAPTIMPYKWKTRVFQLNAKHNYEVMRIWFNVPAGTTTQNATRNVASTQTLAADQYGVVRVYAGDGAPSGSDGTPMTLFTTREIRNSGELLRILSGQKFEYWQFEFEGRVEIIGVQIANTVKELSNA